MSAPSLIRIVARRVSWPDIRVGGNRAGLRLLWDALHESGTLIVAATEYPLADASRALIQRGENPETLVTMRHEGAAYDSFVPVPLRIPATQSERQAERAERDRQLAV